ncbi:Yip1 family protein [Lihuaxuella thermophila]|nr:Yip1 family protein [Lihuaxuella thermophila]
MESIREIFISMWRHPKSAIRQAIDQHSRKFTIWLVILFGITLFVEQASNRNLGDDFSSFTIFILSLLLGPLFGMTAWVFLSGISYGTARILGGTGTWEETRIATTWATLPYISKWIVLFFQLIMFRGELFTSETPIMDASPFLMVSFLLLSILDFAMTFWYIYVFSNAIAEVHDFSAWKGFLSVILIPLLLVLFLFILATVL